MLKCLPEHINFALIPFTIMTFLPYHSPRYKGSFLTQIFTKCIQKKVDFFNRIMIQPKNVSNVLPFIKSSMVCARFSRTPRQFFDHVLS